MLIALLIVQLASLLALLFIAQRIVTIPASILDEATKNWKDAFVREIREARLENRKLHKAELPSDRRPN